VKFFSAPLNEKTIYIFENTKDVFIKLKVPEIE